MKFNVKVDDAEVQLQVTFHCGYAGSYIYNFSHRMESKSSAGLVAQAVHNQFNDHIEAIRRDAYEQGWKDKRQKNRKRTWFGDCPNNRKMT